VAADLMVCGSDFREFWKESKENRSGPSKLEGHVAADKRNRDFTSQRFQHGARRKFPKREIVKRPGVGPVVTARGHIGGGPKKKVSTQCMIGDLGFQGSNHGRRMHSRSDRRSE
jgi:hypothetical protein